MSSSIERTVQMIWENDAVLCSLIPFAQVFTGRIPKADANRFPYVSILFVPGRAYKRSSHSRLVTGVVSFHIWVDDADLEFGKTVAKAIADSYSDRAWALSSTDKVYDVEDMGEPLSHQTDLPSVKAWEVVKMFTVFIDRKRVRTGEDSVNLTPPDDSHEF